MECMVNTRTIPFFFKLRAFLLFIGSCNLGFLQNRSRFRGTHPSQFTYECRVTTLHLYIAERNHHRRWFTVQQFLPFSFPLSNSFFPFNHSLPTHTHTLFSPGLASFSHPSTGSVIFTVRRSALFTKLWKHSLHYRLLSLSLFNDFSSIGSLMSNNMSLSCFRPIYNYW